jgi:hypothetical protein
MAQKPENSFISGVHRQLDLKKVYKEKMSNPWRSGTADMWYSGSEGDVWIEYKFIPKVPKSAAISPDLSPRQRKWLRDRYEEGRSVAVVLGHPDGAYVYLDCTWEDPISSVHLLQHSISRSVLAAWIRAQTGDSPCLSQRL